MIENQLTLFPWCPTTEQLLYMTSQNWFGDLGGHEVFQALRQMYPEMHFSTEDVEHALSIHHKRFFGS